jgi:hypothetical protein
MCTPRQDDNKAVDMFLLFNVIFGTENVNKFGSNKPLQGLWC